MRSTRKGTSAINWVLETVRFLFLLLGTELGSSKIRNCQIDFSSMNQRMATSLEQAFFMQTLFDTEKARVT